MLLESLIAVVCINNQGGCGTATTAYYNQSKDIQEIVREVGAFGQQVIGKHDWMVYVATPVYALASRQPANIPVARGWLITVDPYNPSVGIMWSY